MKLSDIPTERLKQVAENFSSSKSDQVAFFEWPPILRPIVQEGDSTSTITGTSTTFTKNEILDELEARQFRQELRD